MKLADIAGLPVGHVPRVLASCVYKVLACGVGNATVTCDPVQSFLPWPAPSERGGGTVTLCEYILHVSDEENVLTMLKEKCKRCQRALLSALSLYQIDVLKLLQSEYTFQFKQPKVKVKSDPGRLINVCLYLYMIILSCVHPYSIIVLLYI